MLKNIKSSYFIKLIFSYLDDECKLKLIRYNKYFQNLTELTLLDYKLYSGRYINLETKEKGKEYECQNEIDLLIYEGGYLNGKRNGEGKEYNAHGFLIYEGEYLNGKKDGKGKEYFPEDILVFEGIYKKGKRWDGYAYDPNGDIIYQIKDGEGCIKEYDYSYYMTLIDDIYIKIYTYTITFEGNYLNGEKNGKGKEYNDYGQIIFEGEYLNGKKWNGKGYDNEGNIIYELNNGNGTIKENYEHSPNIIYEGELVNGKKFGKGKEYNIKKKLIFDGEYKYNHKIKGKEFFNNGELKYEGEYLYDRKWNGKGYNQNGNIIYELIMEMGK